MEFKKENPREGDNYFNIYGIHLKIIEKCTLVTVDNNY